MSAPTDVHRPVCARTNFCEIDRRREREELAVHNVVIIGSGCAGLTAAIYAARANLKPLVIDGHEPGGQLTLTTMVENFPGFPDGILGPELIEKRCPAGAAAFERSFTPARSLEVNLRRAPFSRFFAAKAMYEAQALIVAAGASARLLGLESERKLVGHGLSTCATCDGFFFRGKGDCRGRRRRYRHGRGHFPDPFRQPRSPDSSPQRISRHKNHARSRAQQ